MAGWDFVPNQDDGRGGRAQVRGAVRVPLQHVRERDASHVGFGERANVAGELREAPHRRDGIGVGVLDFQLEGEGRQRVTRLPVANLGEHLRDGHRLVGEALESESLHDGVGVDDDFGDRGRGRRRGGRVGLDGSLGGVRLDRVQPAAHDGARGDTRRARDEVAAASRKSYEPAAARSALSVPWQCEYQ